MNTARPEPAQKAEKGSNRSFLLLGSHFRQNLRRLCWIKCNRCCCSNVSLCNESALHPTTTMGTPRFLSRTPSPRPPPGGSLPLLPPILPPPPPISFAFPLSLSLTALRKSSWAPTESCKSSEVTCFSIAVVHWSGKVARVSHGNVGGGCWQALCCEDCSGCRASLM